jgi:type II secretory pathway pseudopilin PulG
MNAIPTNHLVAAILAGAVIVGWLLYLAVRSLGRSRDEAERNREIYEREYERHQYPKL